jgi:DNA polymerase III delta subunit
MPNYSQWRTSADKGQVARVTWLCGDQRVLVEEVIEETKRILDLTEFDYVVLSGDSSPVEIWDAAYQYSLDPTANRLVLVREADKVKQWGPLKKWFKDSRKLVSTYLMFVSDEADYPVVPDTKNVELQEHIELIRTKGKTVRCSMPSSGELTSWVVRNSMFKEPTAKFLIGRSGGDLNIIANICKKSWLFKEDPGQSVVAQLAGESPSQTFADALLEMKKTDALNALSSLPEDEYVKVVGQLYSRLDTLQTLNKTLPNFTTYKELAEATGVKIFLIQKYGFIAKHYSPEKVSKCRSLLTIVDDAIQRRAYAGTMELLVTLW